MLLDANLGKGPRRQKYEENTVSLNQNDFIFGSEALPATELESELRNALRYDTAAVYTSLPAAIFGEKVGSAFLVITLVAQALKVGRMSYQKCCNDTPEALPRRRVWITLRLSDCWYCSGYYSSHGAHPASPERSRGCGCCA
jgi:hypothetical protein